MSLTILSVSACALRSVFFLDHAIDLARRQAVVFAQPPDQGVVERLGQQIAVGLHQVEPHVLAFLARGRHRTAGLAARLGAEDHGIDPVVHVLAQRLLGGDVAAHLAFEQLDQRALGRHHHAVAREGAQRLEQRVLFLLAGVARVAPPRGGCAEAVVELVPGDHAGALEIHRPVELQAQAAAVGVVVLGIDPMHDELAFGERRAAASSSSRVSRCSAGEACSSSCT